MARCARCGTENPADVSLCVSCGTSLTSPSVMSFPTMDDDLERAVPYASWLERLGAFILDQLILIIPIALAGLVMRNRFAGNLVSFAYYIYFTGSSGQTIGKRALGIRVTKADGSPVDYGVAALRETIGKFVSGIILGIGFLFPLWDARRQALHDKVASTVVVKVTSSMP
jgi:uncharacterized RDD family membrane protein YckC